MNRAVRGGQRIAVCHHPFWPSNQKGNMHTFGALFSTLGGHVLWWLWGWMTFPFIMN